MDPLAKLREAMIAVADLAEHYEQRGIAKGIRDLLPPRPGAPIADDLPEGSMR